MGESVAQRPSALIQPLSAQGIVVSYDAHDFASEHLSSTSVEAPLKNNHQHR